MMDFDIGNILYIVITLVAVIVGLLGKKKKPAEGGSGGEGSEARPGFMENLERVLQMGQEEPVIRDLQEFEEDLPAEEFAVVQTPEEAYPEVRNRPSIMDEYDRIMKSNPDGGYNLNGPDGENMTEALEVIDLDEITGTDYFEIVKDFDAGTAVVYSAIINRLDY
jgi:hypothetical protein